MAIIIPSRSIYKIQNPKVRDNLISKIEVSGIIPSLENQSIFQSYFSIYTSKNGKYTYNLNDYESTISQNSYEPTIQDKVFTNSGKYESHYVYFEIKNIEYGKPTKKSNCNLTITQNGTDEILNEGVTKLEYNNNLGIGTEKTSTIPYAFKKYDSIEEFESEILNYNFNDGTTQSDLGYVQCGIIFRDFDFDVLLLLKKYEKTSLGSYFRIQQNYNIEINLDLLNTVDKTVTIGDGNKPLSFDGNELMQTTNRLNTATSGETNAIEYLFNNTLNAFKNGKETATIRCSIGEYKDQSGNVVISPNGYKRIFEVGDEVIPMVYTNVGDKAMSNYKDGNDKIFKVLATNIHAQGVAWQDLTLQEK